MMFSGNHYEVVLAAGAGAPLALGLHFDGTISLGNILFAAGTFMLAFFTWRLARQAEGEINVSERSIRLMRQSIEAQEAPFIVLAAKREGKETLSVVDGHVHCVIWNIGCGPGIMNSFKLLTREGGVLTEEVEEEIPLMIDDKADLRRRILSPVDLHEGARLILSLHYRDASGLLYQTVSNVTMGADEHMHCRNFQKLRTDPF